ncbi:DNA recombination protein [Gammaproteobacteria bacterium]
MTHVKTIHECRECGGKFPKWAGQCSECGAWNTLEETVETSGTPAKLSRFATIGVSEGNIQSLARVDIGEEIRSYTGLDELDRVLGGGLVEGSVILIGGDPGIGKSTLLLQTLANLHARLLVLYVTGEESLRQVSMRARRLGLGDVELPVLAETRIEAVLAAARTAPQPRVMVIDSIQTVYTELLHSAPGSVSQVRESAAQLVRYAKGTGTALFLVGHVTKEGILAGPRVLEHMVDTVLYFEGDTGSTFRVVRAIKNRFGAVNELGVFAMTERGLRGVSNPSAIFLSRGEEEAPGSVVLVAREGTRPLLVEVQALVDESHSPTPRRVCLGLDPSRMAMLLAVLHRHCGVITYDQDVFVNLVGGVRVSETAADLPVLAAVLSSLRNRPLSHHLVLFGEVGLSGEIRPVPGGQERLREAAKHGFTRAIIPRANVPKKNPEGLEVISVQRLQEALDCL